MKIGVLSDTHGYIGNDMLETLRCCQEIWHIGDVGSLDVLSQLRDIGELRVVYGNIDGRDIRGYAPEYLVFDIEGLRIVMLHIGGYPGRYTSRAKELILQHQPNIFLSGHSHILKIMPDRIHDLLHINPGAAGKSGFHTVRTMVQFDIIDYKVLNMQVVEFDK